MKISQSLIKDIVPEGFCPHYIHLKYKVGVKTEPSEAMENGLFFESELLGSARGGKYELPKMKSGKPYKRELDIIENVNYAKHVFEQLKIKVDEVQPYKEKENRSGHFDFVGNMGNARIIGDVKWTGMAKDKFERELKYNLLESYKTQARHYQSILPGLDFYFFIFGKSGWSKIIRFAWNESEVNEHLEIVELAEVKYNTLQDYEVEPTYNKCNACRLKDNCKLAIDIPTIEDYTEYL